MNHLLRQYFDELVHSIGAGWNRFWYQPSGCCHLALLRHLVGLVALVWLGSYSFQLDSLFGASGLVTLRSVHQVMTSGDPTQAVPGLSHLFFVESFPWLALFHVAGLLVLLGVALGIWPAITTPLGLVVVLSYIHRGPTLTGTLEPVLCMLLLYLSLAPSASLFSRRAGDCAEESWRANLATRLIQVHVCGFYLLIAASKLGSLSWWTGDATAYLLSDAQHRLIDLTFLSGQTFALNGLTHVWVVFELLYVVLIWNRLARPLMIAGASTLWLFTGLITGQLGYAAIMIAAQLAFVPSPVVAAVLRRGGAPRREGRRVTAGAAASN